MFRIALITFLALVGAPREGHSQTARRYESEVFSSFQVQKDIQFGQSTTVGGNAKQLYLDVYTGTGDTSTWRPLVLFIHGGGFKGGDKVSNFGTLVCGGLARRGYVVASINYRVSTTINDYAEQFEAMIRALQDARAAVRFFRKSPAQYGVDTSQVFATGSSAGCITALHMAYLDSTEAPSYVRWGNVGGTLEGTSGNPGYSSRINGVISNWGAIGDTSWIKPGDVPVFCVHGLADSTVYYDLMPADESFTFSSKYIIQRARNISLKAGIRTFQNTGHTLDNNSTKQDSAYRDFSAWLFTLLRSSQVPTAAPRGETQLPSGPALRANYPNPFNPKTVVSYRLSVPGWVRLGVHDLLGHEVAVLVDGKRDPGVHQVTFDGSGLASGVYFCRLTAQDFTDVRRMMLVR